MRSTESSLASSIRRAGPLAIDLALRLTLLDLLLRPVGNWALRPLILGLAVIGLLKSTWLRQPLLWLCLTTLTGARVLLDWPLADNHAYLLAYWCLAIFLALLTPNSSKALAINGRLLIGLVFLFACIWKFAASGNYVDGTFFQVTLLTDPRFEGFSRVAGGLDQEAYKNLHDFVTQHRDAAATLDDGHVEIPTRLKALAIAATVWNLLMNTALAIAFLWPTRRGLVGLGHVLLLTYCAVTYAVATVDGFGWLLIAMGVAQCDVDQRRTRFLYVVVFVLIIFYREVPWADSILLPLLHK